MPYATRQNAPGIWPSKKHDWMAEGDLYGQAFVHVKPNDPGNIGELVFHRRTPRKFARGPRLVEPALASTYAECAVAKPTIQTNVQVLRGKPCVAGTRIPVALVLRYLATDDDPLEDLDLSAKDVADCLEYAALVCDYALIDGI